MTQRFRQGQNVEVWSDNLPGATFLEAMQWRKAKIVGTPSGDSETYCVLFPDVTEGVFDAEHIRAIPWSLDDPEIRKSLQLDGWTP